MGFGREKARSKNVKNVLCNEEISHCFFPQENLKSFDLGERPGFLDEFMDIILSRLLEVLVNIGCAFFPFVFL